MMSFVATPALAISVMPCAASVAEYCVSLPNRMARSRSASSSVPVARDAADAADIAWSNSANFTTARASPAPIASPAPVAESPTFFHAARCLSTLSAALPENSRVAFPACLMPAR